MPHGTRRSEAMRAHLLPSLDCHWLLVSRCREHRGAAAGMASSSPASHSVHAPRAAPNGMATTSATAASASATSASAASASPPPPKSPALPASASPTFAAVATRLQQSFERRREEQRSPEPYPPRCLDLPTVHSGGTRVPVAHGGSLLGHSAATRPAPPPLPPLPALPAAPPSRIGYLSRASSTELLRSADASQSPKSISQTLSLPPPHGDGLLATLRLPFVGSMAIAYALLKPTRSTLHFWLPFFMRTGHGYSEAAVASCLMLYDLGGLVRPNDARNPPSFPPPTCQLPRERLFDRMMPGTRLLIATFDPMGAADSGRVRGDPPPWTALPLGDMGVRHTRR